MRATIDIVLKLSHWLPSLKQNKFCKQQCLSHSLQNKEGVGGRSVEFRWRLECVVGKRYLEVSQSD